MTTHQILADISANILELKKNPMAVFEEGKGFPVAILNSNTPVFYVVPASAYEQLMDKLEDMELAQIIREREGQASTVVTLDKF